MVIEIKAIDCPEPVSQWWTEQGITGGGADERETGQIETQALGAGALADDDIQGKIFQRRVEDFFHGTVEPVNLIDEEDIVGFQIGQYRGQVTGAFDGRAGGRPDVGAHLRGDDMSQAGLAEPGRSVEQDMIQGFLAALGRGDSYLEVFLGLFLSRKLGQVPGPQTGIQ